ncbi:hypothetical protein DV736_g6151, partial [Chaetothyriales sp. CBS 134916]
MVARHYVDLLPPPPLGHAVPNNIHHAISVQMPEWEDMKGLLLRTERILKVQKIGYPRSFIHPDVADFHRRILEKTSSQTTRTSCLAFPALRHAEACVHLVKAKNTNALPEVVEIALRDSNQSLVALVYAVLYDTAYLNSALEFWRLTGTGISSRFAESVIVKGLDISTSNEWNGIVKSISRQSDGYSIIIRERICHLLNRSPLHPEISALVTPSEVYLYPTGMSAIYHTSQALKRWRNTQSVVFGFLYELTPKLLQLYSESFHFYGFGTEAEIDQLEIRLEENQKSNRPVQSVWCECPSNPLLHSVNLTRLRRLANKYLFALIVDETIGTFANLDLLPVADVLITSLTKAFSGNADVMGGSVVLNPSSPLYQDLKQILSETYVPELHPQDAAVLEYNSRQFLPRIDKMNSNAYQLVTLLSSYASQSNSVITKVFHPSILPSRVNYDPHLRRSTPEMVPGHGGLFTIEFESEKAASTFFNHLDLHKGPSLGACVTLAQPYVQTVFALEKEWAAYYGLSETIVRISVGLEDPHALTRAFRKAFNMPDDDAAAGIARKLDVQGDIAAEAYQGVDDMERVTQHWGYSALVFTYFCLWGVYLLWGFERSFERNLGPNIQSLFGKHSYLATVSLAANIASGAVYMPLAKILDKYGRVQAFLAMNLVTIMGSILIAGCHNIATYIAGIVFVTVGFSALSYCTDVLTADTSVLASRGIALAITGCGSIITGFGGSAASAHAFAPGQNWRWSYGALSICIPVVGIIMGYLLFKFDRKAREDSSALTPPTKPKRNIVQKIGAFVLEFDILGVLIFITGEVLFLLPFSLAESAPHGWSTGYIIAMIVLGFLILAGFVLYEKFVAPIPVADWKLLTTPTLLNIIVINALLSIAISTWDAYFTSYLRVVYGQSLADAGYINSVTNTVSPFWTFIVAFIIRGTGRYKWLFFSGSVVYTLFVGLLIYFRRPGTRIGYIIMCEVFLSFAQSQVILGVQVGAVAAVTHRQVAAAIGILGVSGYIGNALGDTIQGAIWTNSLPAELQARLPANLLDKWDDIYGDIDQQLAYPIGSPARTAIIDSYAVAQTRMLTAGVVVSFVMVVLIALLKDIRLKKNPQAKGKVIG